MKDEDIPDFLRNIANGVEHLEAADNRELLLAVSNRIEQLVDEINSAWAMLDEMRNSDIENFRTLIAGEIKNSIEERRKTLTKVEEA